MTLIAGFRCTDGFVIAADTAVTFGNVTIQGHKMTESGPGDPYTLCIGSAGNLAFALDASQRIRDAVKNEMAASLRAPLFADIRRIVSDILIEFYDKQMLRDWKLAGLETPWISLIIGIEDSERTFGVLRTDYNSVYEVDQSAFSGSGAETAAYFCERVFDGKSLPAAVTHHLAQQLFRELKGKSTYVGGNTEIFSRRSTPSARPFFNIPSFNAEHRAMWALDDKLLSAVRLALNTRFHPLPGQDLPAPLEKRINDIRKRLTKLYIDCHDEENVTIGDEQHTTEFGTEIGHPWKDEDD